MAESEQLAVGGVLGRAAKHGDLVPQHEQLDVLRGGRTADDVHVPEPTAHQRHQLGGLGAVVKAQDPNCTTLAGSQGVIRLVVLLSLLAVSHWA
jgi:hypothetical protein